MADTMMDNLAGSMTLMQSAVEGVQNSFGKRLSPYLKSAVEGITAEMPAVEEARTISWMLWTEKLRHLNEALRV